MATPSAPQGPADTPAVLSERWEVGVISLPFLLSKGAAPPQAPQVALVVDARGRIRAMQPGSTEDLPALLQASLQQAIAHPAGGGSPGQPMALAVPQRRLQSTLQALYPTIPIELGPTPNLMRAAASLLQPLQTGGGGHGGPAAGDGMDDDPEAGTSDHDPAGRTYLSRDISAAAMGEFFAAAAALHRTGFWHRIGPDARLFRLSCAALRMRGWVGCVLGESPEVGALLCFRSLSSCERYLASARRAAATGRLSGASVPEHLILNFEPASAVPEPLLGEIRQQGWPLAADDICPLLLHVRGDLTSIPLDLQDLRQLEVMVRGLTALLESATAIAPAAPGSSGQRLLLPLAGETVAIRIGLLPAAVQALAADDQEGPDGGATDPAAGVTGAAAGGCRPGTPPPPADRDADSGPAEATARPGLGRIPAALKDRVASLLEALDPFCAAHLDAEYRRLIHAALGALARKRPSPLLGGREPSWCAGIVHAVGIVNFLFDRHQTPHCTSAQIYDHFGVSPQTGQAHSKKVRDLLGIRQFDWQWTLPSRWDDNSLVWMIQVDGFHLDARRLSEAIQVEAWQRGLIPYVPAHGRPAGSG
jgi:hypothetical protein